MKHSNKEKILLSINGLNLDAGCIDYLISQIKKNKHYAWIQNDFIIPIIRKFSFENFALLKKAYPSLKDSAFEKRLVKFARAELRKRASLYLTKSSTKLLTRFMSCSDISKQDLAELCFDFLSSHQSTRERLGIYDSLYHEIARALIPKLSHKSDAELKNNYAPSMPELAFLDLGCGFNPFSYLLMPDYLLNKSQFTCLDIDKRVVDALNKFFNLASIKGKAVIADALSFSDQARKAYDCVLAFKLLEILDVQGHKNSEKIITSLNFKLFVASFSRKTISGKSMTLQRKPWLERMLARIGYQYDIIEFESEIFYFIKKSKPNKHNSKNPILPGP